MIMKNPDGLTTEPKTGSNEKVDDEKRLLKMLERKWKSHCGRGLSVRHEMGALLNRSLGSPDKRQPHGVGVVSRAAKQLAISESELSRMRWLAHLFEDIASLKKRMPECHSWTEFKRLLPTLKPAVGDSVAAESVTRSQPAIRGVVRSIDSISAKIERLGDSPEIDRCRELLKELKTAIKACANRPQETATAEANETEENSLELCAASA